MANMACGNSGLNLGHAMVLPLSAQFGIPHGIAAGAILPYVLEFNLPVAGKRLLPLIMAMGFEPDAGLEYLLKELVSLLEDLNFPKDLEGLGVKQSALSEMAGQVVKFPMAKSNLRKANANEVLNIYKAAFSGRKKE